MIPTGKFKDRIKSHNKRSFNTSTKCTITIVRGRNKKAIQAFLAGVSKLVECDIYSLDDISRCKEYRSVHNKTPAFIYADGTELDTLENVVSLANMLHDTYNKPGHISVTIMLHDILGPGDNRAFEFSDDSFFCKFDKISHSLVIHKYYVSSRPDGKNKKEKEWFQ